jgi:putative transposase
MLPDCRRRLQSPIGETMCHPSENRSDPHGSFLRAGRWSETLACYAVTKCVARREPLLAEPAPAQLVLSSLRYLRTSGQIRLLAFCIMPDHYHMVLFLTGHKSLSDVMGSLGKYTARRLNQLLHRRGEFWEEGFYDHRCRDESDIEDRMIYIEHNPVRAGLAVQAEDWPFSSAHPPHGSLLDRDWYARVR